MAENAKMLDRATYKKIKGMTREERVNPKFCVNEK